MSQRSVSRLQLTLAQKLAAGFAGMLLLLLSISLVNALELRAMGTQLRSIVDENNPKSALAQRMLSSILEMSIQARSIALLTDAEAIQAEARRLKAAQAAYAEAEAQLARLSQQAGTAADEAGLVQAIVAQGQRTLPLILKAAQEGQDGANIQATETLTATVRPLEMDWQARVGELIALEAQHNQQADAAARAGLGRALMLGAAMLALAVALGGLLAWRIIRSVRRPIEGAIAVAERIARGDLSGQVRVESSDEVGRLLQAVALMQQRLRELVAEIRLSAESVQIASAEVSAGSLDLQGRTEAAASNLRDTADSMEQLSGAVRLTAESAGTANKLATAAASVAHLGGKAVAEVVAKMADISASSKRISDIIGVIDAIAFQTNVLALNAAVEAARAGESGRGFAVVAAEVRGLARRSAEAAKEIKGLIETSVASIQSGARLVNGAGGTMDELLASVRSVTDIIAEISSASAQQSQGIARVSGAVTALDEMTQHNSALVEQSTAAAEMLREQALRLMELVLSFRIQVEPQESA